MLRKAQFTANAALNCPSLSILNQQLNHLCLTGRALTSWTQYLTPDSTQVDNGQPGTLLLSEKRLGVLNDVAEETSAGFD
mmetsp:Transcript_24022/g.41873  ORF Transcript_24022/g.41873 Transcript_24022/m.41873 type:complete len:80 (+) Transcript_24022:685-924(+)